MSDPLALLSIASIVLCAWAFLAVFPEARKLPPSAALHHIAAASASLTVIAVLHSSMATAILPASWMKTTDVIVLLACAIPAVYWLVMYFGGGFR